MTAIQIAALALGSISLILSGITAFENHREWRADKEFCESLHAKNQTELHMGTEAGDGHVPSEQELELMQEGRFEMGK